MLHHLDPMNAQSRTACALLTDLFKKHQDHDVFSRYETFKLGSTDVQLTQTVLRAPTNQADQSKYHIISNRPLGNGANGTVYAVELDMLVSADHVVTYARPNPSQVVKRQFVPFSSDEDSVQKSKNKWNHEYEQSKDGHLDAEVPLFKVHGQRGMEMFLPMNRMPGIEFFDFLGTVLEPRSHVSSYFRFLLTFELLNSFYEQVVRYKKVHGDLKPSNMMFAMNVKGSYKTFVLNGGLRHNAHIPRWKLNVIDFEGCEQFDVPRKFFSCTDQYAAPETLIMANRLKTVPNPIYPAVHDEKLDLASIAIIIGVIWGLVPSDAKKLVTLDDPALMLEQLTRLCFDDEPEAFSASFLAPIYAAIACMIDPDPAKRWNLEQSNMFFEDLFARYNQKAFFKPVSAVTPEVTASPDSVAFEWIADNYGSQKATGDESTKCSPLPMLGEEERKNIIVLDRSPRFFVKPQPQHATTTISEKHATCECILS
jgi:serine/threonine protein kinase